MPACESTTTLVGTGTLGDDAEFLTGRDRERGTHLKPKGKGSRRGGTVAQMESALLSPKPSEDEFVPFFLIDGFGAAGFSEV